MFRLALIPGLFLMTAACGGQPGEELEQPAAVAGERDLATQAQPLDNCYFVPDYAKYWFAQDPAHGHDIGRPMANDAYTWWARPVDYPAGFLTFGPYDTNMGAGTYRASFYLRTYTLSSWPWSNNDVVTIEVVGQFGNKVYARKTLTESDFDYSSNWKFFHLDFKNPCYDVIEARVWSHDNNTVEHHVTLLQFQSWDY